MFFYANSNFHLEMGSYNLLGINKMEILKDRLMIDSFNKNNQLDNYVNNVNTNLNSENTENKNIKNLFSNKIFKKLS